MPSSQTDLSVLSRTASSAAPRMESIPEPASRWKTRLLLPGVVLFCFSALLAYAARDALIPARTVMVVPVVAKTAAGAGGGIAFQAAGWVEPDPFPTHVSALSDGIVKEVLVLEGQQIKAGDVVARLVDDEARLALARAEADLKMREAAVKMQQAALNAAQREWDNPVERKRALVVAENVLLEHRGELARLQPEIAVETAKAAELEEQLKRETSAGEAIPEFQKTQTRLRLNIQLAALELVKSRKPILEADVVHQEGELAAARDNMKLRISETKMLEETKAAVLMAEAARDLSRAMRDEAALRLARMEVRSPADGTVMLRRAIPGGKLMVGMDDPHSAHAVDIYDPQKLQVRVDVPLSEAASVSVGQKAQIVVEVLRDTVFEGHVTRIVNEADIQKNTLQVKVAIDKPASALKPEMLARVQFVASAQKETGATTQRVFAPENLLMKEGGSASVWIVDKGRGTAQKRAVTAGTLRMEGWVEIASGLQPGDSLITGDRTSLREGERVHMVEDTAATGATTGGTTHGSH